VYADFRREYRLDLLDELDAGMSWWRFAALLSGLSEHSTWRKVAGDEPVELSTEDAQAEIANW
jgi:hypothetical protein